MALDGVPASPYRLAFRKLVALLQQDATLKRTVKSWHVFDGSKASSDAEPFGEGELPACRLLPFAQGASPESTTAQNSPFGVRAEIAVDGYNLDDLLDLWSAFHSAIFKGDGTATAFKAIQDVLDGTGASLNSINLAQPAITPNPTNLADGVLYAAGTLTVNLMVKK